MQPMHSDDYGRNVITARKSAESGHEAVMTLFTPETYQTITGEYMEPQPRTEAAHIAAFLRVNLPTDTLEALKVALFGGLPS